MDIVTQLRVDKVPNLSRAMVEQSYVFQNLYLLTMLFVKSLFKACLVCLFALDSVFGVQISVSSLSLDLTIQIFLVVLQT